MSLCTNALYRDRMSASAVGAATAPEWKGPQHFSYASDSPHGQERVVMTAILPGPARHPARRADGPA
ncbi:hypothetical protein GCM10010448_02920 [Streptomyces glomeratus]|uniref:Uncharacterized protein n=1 Tax=Streptomyces glomeratus TaxID=284452 RepID=A0ABP6L015_9ACTN